ncbi:MAG: sulfotransferase family 2 domain-containing protein [Nitrospirota bacterium]
MIGITSHSRQIIFAHQPKSAGTTLVQMFRKSYGRANVYHDMDREHLMPPLTQAVWRLWEALRMSNRRRYKIIHGHFPAVKYRRSFPDAFYMTFFRHPVERLASHYFYWLRTPNLAKPHPLAHWLHEKSPDIVAFAQRFHSRDEQLSYVKYFWPDDFDFIGITELYADSLRMLQERLPELCTEVEPQRVNAAKGIGNYDLSSEERAKLEEILWLRIAVYERARFLFEGRRQLLD